ncbi:MAG: rhodanese-like domain-containing protein [Salinibacterium sp.]|nr:MAG: rhodanese-like domain-containing protein [Salinibacterium sp.]
MAYPDDPMPDISAAEAIALVEAGTFLLDVREQHEWDAGHAPGAHWLPRSTLKERLDEVPRDRTVLVTCLVGGRSFRVTDLLLREGFDAVNLVGGMEAWHAAGGPLVSDGPEAPRLEAP